MPDRPQITPPPLDFEPDQRRSLADFDALLTEQQVCERYPLLVGPRELRKARQSGTIPFTPGKKGVVLYHPEDLVAYFSSKAKKCGNSSSPSSSNMGDTGSPEPTAPLSSTHTGMSEEAELLLENHLEQKYSRKPKRA